MQPSRCTEEAPLDIKSSSPISSSSSPSSSSSSPSSSSSSSAFLLHWGGSAQHDHHHQYHRHCVWQGSVSNNEHQQQRYEYHQNHQHNRGIFISIMIVKVLFDTAPFQSWTRCKAGQPPLQSVNIEHRHDHHHCLINITILITALGLWIITKCTFPYRGCLN